MIFSEIFGDTRKCNEISKKYHDAFEKYHDMFRIL